MSTKYRVEWLQPCNAVLDDCGDFDYDASIDKESRQDFATEADAVAFAAQLVNDDADFFGCPLVHRMELVECDLTHRMKWIYAAQVEYLA